LVIPAFFYGLTWWQEPLFNRLEHDPDPKGRVGASGDRFSEKIMLKQQDEIMIRFNLIGS